MVATAWQARVARLETAKAQRINAFLQEMLSSSSPGYDSPNVRKDPDIKVSEVVAGAARRAETELADQPEVLAEIQRTIGAAYYAQGRYDQAEQILRSALDKYSTVFGHDSPETVEASNLLANVLLRKQVIARRPTRSSTGTSTLSARRRNAGVSMSAPWPMHWATTDRCSIIAVNNPHRPIFAKPYNMLPS